jgi:hypothetical protein
MRETRSYGSVRGAAGNSRPYREPGPGADSRAAATPPLFDRLVGAVEHGEQDREAEGLRGDKVDDQRYVR